MTFVVTDACIQCKYTDCVAVCPVDCFHEGPNFLVINPDGCVDCGICVPECPANAIYADVDLPADQQHFLQLNADLASHAAWPVLTEQKPPMLDHASWLDVKNKLDKLDRHGA
jgi:ferredoxin